MNMLWFSSHVTHIPGTAAVCSAKCWLQWGEDGGCAQGGRLYVMPAVKDAHTLCVTFQLPSLLKAYRKKADEYLSHLIGHEGRGSLFSLLKVSFETDSRDGVWKMTSGEM